MQNNCITNFIKTVQQQPSTHGQNLVQNSTVWKTERLFLDLIFVVYLSHLTYTHTFCLYHTFLSHQAQCEWSAAIVHACFAFMFFFPESFSLMLCPVSEHFNVPDFKQMYISLKCVYIVYMVQSTCMFRVIFYVVLIQCSDYRTYNQLLTAWRNNPMNLSHSLVKFWGASEAKKYVKCKSDKEINHCCVCSIKATHCDTMN